MADALASGKAVLAEWVSRLPEANRAAVQAILDTAEAQAAVQFIGEGTLRQADYSRAMNDLTEKVRQEDQYRQELEAWGATHKQELEDLRAYRAAHPEPASRTEPPVSPNPDPARPAAIQSPSLDPTQIQESVLGTIRKEMDQREQDYAAFLAESQPLTVQHFKDFGEVLDLRKLMQHPEIGKVGLQGVYKIVYADQIRARDEAATAATRKSIEDAAYAKAKADLLAQGATVFPPPSEGGSPLDTLGRKPAEGAPAAPADLARAAAAVYDAEVARQGVG
jgi:hypothetical protein